MPEVSRFYGIVIQIYFGDHPPPHFHARYGGNVAKIDIDALTVIDGRLPARALGLLISALRMNPCGDSMEHGAGSGEYEFLLPAPRSLLHACT